MQQRIREPLFIDFMGDGADPDADEHMPTCPSQIPLTHLSNHVVDIPDLHPTKAS